MQRSMNIFLTFFILIYLTILVEHEFGNYVKIYELETIKCTLKIKLHCMCPTSTEVMHITAYIKSVCENC